MAGFWEHHEGTTLWVCQNSSWVNLELNWQVLRSLRIKAHTDVPTHMSLKSMTLCAWHKSVLSFKESFQNYPILEKGAGVELKKWRVTFKSKTDLFISVIRWALDFSKKEGILTCDRFLFHLISGMKKITLCFLVMCLLKVISHGYEQGKDTLL